MGTIFKRGLIALAPIAISVAVIIWLLKVLEDIFRIPLQWLVGEYYFPGMGLLLAFILIFFAGVALNNYLIQRCTRWFDRVLARIPLFKTVYNSIGDLMHYFKPDDEGSRGKMVIVEIGSVEFLAILTREEFSDLPEGLTREDQVSVFIPFSYQIGGFTAFVSKSKIRVVPLTVDQGMRFMITAGIFSNKKQSSTEAKPFYKD